ncbi:MAG: L-serine ammonia-lyase, iron-sulfur-dependent, subunit alpha [Bacillota bacterium]
MNIDLYALLRPEIRPALGCTGSAAVQAVLLAKSGLAAAVEDGIIGDTVEETIRNLGAVSNPGMVETDRVILDVMLQKQNQ